MSRLLSLPTLLVSNVDVVHVLFAEGADRFLKAVDCKLVVIKEVSFNQLPAFALDKLDRIGAQVDNLELLSLFYVLGQIFVPLEAAHDKHFLHVFVVQVTRRDTDAHHVVSVASAVEVVQIATVELVGQVKHELGHFARERQPDLLPTPFTSFFFVGSLQVKYCIAKVGFFGEPECTQVPSLVDRESDSLVVLLVDSLDF